MSLHRSVTAAFNVNGVKKEKGYYKTANGAKLIRKTTDTMQQIIVKHQMTEHCIKNDYPWVERYHLAKNGQPYAPLDGGYYIMTDNITYPEADFIKEDEFLKVVEFIALWHKTARGFSLAPNKPLTEVIKSQIEVLEATIKRVRKQSKWSDFDVLFLKNYPEYIEMVQKSLKMLDETSYIERFNNARQQAHICHGGLKEDVLRVGEHVHITKFDQASVGYQLNDLCDLIKRREKARANDPQIPQIDINVVCLTYSKIHPLGVDEKDILNAMLLYPQAFVKIVKEYYQKKRTWTPVSMTNKMLQILGKL